MVFSRFDHALENHRDAEEPANERDDERHHRGHLELARGPLLGRRRGLRGLDDLLRRPEPFEHVADPDLADSLLLAQRRLDVLADLRDQLCAS
jgi:hypothetical protein